MCCVQPHYEIHRADRGEQAPTSPELYRFDNILHPRTSGDSGRSSIVVHGGESLGSPQSVVLVFLIHGAAARVPANATAFGARKSNWDLNVISQWSDLADSERHVGWAREL
jgi:hypothetical protein